MKQFQFNYCEKFSCIGSSCKHNCCIGWKIKIDKKALSSYQHLKIVDKKFDNDCFNENEFKETEVNSLFSEDDIFPNIPI